MCSFKKCISLPVIKKELHCLCEIVWSHTHWLLIWASETEHSNISYKIWSLSINALLKYTPFSHNFTSHLTHYLHLLLQFMNSPKGNVLSVHPGCWLECNVKLRTVCVSSFVRHAKDSSSVMLNAKVLVYVQKI